MNAEFRAIAFEDLATYALPQDLEDLKPYARFSDPLFAIMYKDRCACLIGFIPEYLLGDRAYVWMNDLPWLQENKLVAGLAAQRLFKLARLRYPTLFGHCGRHSERWLRSLGAEIDFPKWVIEGKHV
jgi:hypothetical protein